MTNSLFNEYWSAPVTAVLADSDIILAAHGSYLRVYNNDDAKIQTIQRIFDSQIIHGITKYESNQIDSRRYVVWGGRLIAIVHIYLDGWSSVSLEHGNLIESPDWILDISTLQRDQTQQGGIALVTAHNDLLLVNSSNELVKLTKGARCILYAANITWDSPTKILIAGGTAFGEIIVWSCSLVDNNPFPQSHYVFNGHEGSIFGVRISKAIDTPSQGNLRILTSCSDDRTIRVWDITELPLSDIHSKSAERETGFSSAVDDVLALPSTSKCIASAMGHISRIWNIHYVYVPQFEMDQGSVILKIISTGEDATCQVWALIENLSKRQNEPTGYDLQNIGSDSHHSGKNIWSGNVDEINETTSRMITGGADGGIVSREIPVRFMAPFSSTETWSVEEVLRRLYGDYESTTNSMEPISSQKSRKDCFRGFTTFGSGRLLVVTNTGIVAISSAIDPSISPKHQRTWRQVAQLDDLIGYSTAASAPGGDLAFVAGATGSVYCFDPMTLNYELITKAEGKVSILLAENIPSEDSESLISLFVGQIGQMVPHHIVICKNAKGELDIIRDSLLEPARGSIVTSASYSNLKDRELLLLGSRNGDITVLSTEGHAENVDKTPTSFSIFHRFETAHGKEAVTGIRWIHNISKPSDILGWIISIGHDGTCTVHELSTKMSQSRLVHKLTLQFGPDAEGLWVHPSTGELLVYGFHGTHFLVFNISTSQEIMSINCGGAHRVWVFHPTYYPENPKAIGGNLTWNQASKIRMFSSTKQSHQMIQNGGHGRDIKVCAISNISSASPDFGPWIATGAEDTDIRLFKYGTDDSNQPRVQLSCHAILRKHVSGIQCLRWSEDGKYLFSSGGLEEFFVWRLQPVPVIGVGVVCESECPVEETESELRITGFEIQDLSVARPEEGLPKADFLITMVYCNSTIKTYRYSSSGGAEEWNILANGRYTAACLTQAAYLTLSGQNLLLTAATDGSLSIWDMQLPHLSAMNNSSISASKREICQHKLLANKKIHQNSIKTYSHIRLSEHVTLVLTGGDDNALALSLLSLHKPEERASPTIAIQSVLVPLAHAASINGSCLLLDHKGRNDNTSLYAITSGNDQRVKCWQVQLDPTSPELDSITIKKKASKFSIVADASDLAVLDAPAMDTRVLVCGVGMEMWRV